MYDGELSPSDTTDRHAADVTPAAPPPGRELAFVRAGTPSTSDGAGRSAVDGPSFALLPSVFSVLLLSTVVTVAELYIFLTNRDAVASSMRMALRGAGSQLGDLSVDGVLERMRRVPIPRAFSASATAIDDVKSARYGYDAYAVALCVVLALLTLLAYLGDREGVHRQWRTIAGFTAVSVLAIIALQNQLRTEVLSHTEVPTAEEVQAMVARECERRGEAD